MRSRPEVRLIIVALLAFALIVLVPLSIGVYKAGKKKKEEQTLQLIRSTFDTYNFNKKDKVDRWWLAKVPEASIELYQLLESKKLQILMLLQKYKDLSSETEKIVRRFQGLKIALYRNGLAQCLKPVGSPDSDPANTMVICFLSRDVAQVERVFTPMYNAALDMILVPALEIPEPLYASVLFHEFGHALRHNKFDGCPPDAEGTTPYFTEEAAMHGLSGLILNAASDGRYYSLIAEIVDRPTSRSDFTEILAKITSSDYLKADQVFACQEVNLPGSWLSSQVALDVAFRFCDTNRLNAAERTSIYHWFAKHIFNTL
jgi:hypothetical protein